MVGNGLWYRTIRTSSPSHTDHQNNNKKLDLSEKIDCFPVEWVCIFKFVETFEVENCSTYSRIWNWGQQECKECGMIHQLPWIGIAASHVKTKQIMYINPVLNTPSSSNRSKRAEDEYILKEIPPLNYILFAFSPQYMTWPLDYWVHYFRTNPAWDWNSPTRHYWPVFDATTLP